jgi:hypothetical protein
MVSTVLIVVIVLCTGGIFWMRRHRGQADALLISPQTPSPKALALQAFVHGNSCLAAGQFAEASAAFHQVRDLDPTHPHVAGRLAEVARRQHAVSAAPIVKATD